MFAVSWLHRGGEAIVRAYLGETEDPQNTEREPSSVEELNWQKLTGMETKEPLTTTVDPFPGEIGHNEDAVYQIGASNLSNRAQSLPQLLSYCHPNGIPLSLFAIAAESGFTFEYLDLFDRNVGEIEEAASLLKGIFFQDGSWQPNILDNLITELQAHSLVILVPIHTITMVRIRPSVIAHAQDLMSTESRSKYRAAAVRLVACGTLSDNRFLFKYLLPHVKLFCESIQSIHVNDRTGFAQVYLKTENVDVALHMYKDIHRIVERRHGKMHVRTARAKAYMGGVYATVGKNDKRMKLSREVINIREIVLGNDHWETADAWMDLGIALEKERKYEEAEKWKRDALRVATEQLESSDKNIARYTINLAVVLQLQKRHTEALPVYETAIEMRERVFGPSHPLTAEARSRLARCYRAMNQSDKALPIIKEILRCQKEFFGDEHEETMETLTWLARVYADLHSDSVLDSEIEWLTREIGMVREKLLVKQRRNLGVALSRLGRQFFDKKRYTLAWMCWREYIQIRVTSHNLKATDIESVFQQYKQAERPEEARGALKELLAILRESEDVDTGCIAKTEEYIDGLDAWSGTGSLTPRA